MPSAAPHLQVHVDTPVETCRQWNASRPAPDGRYSDAMCVAGSHTRCWLLVAGESGVWQRPSLTPGAALAFAGAASRTWRRASSGQTRATSGTRLSSPSSQQVSGEWVQRSVSVVCTALFKGGRAALQLQRVWWCGAHTGGGGDDDAPEVVRAVVSAMCPDLQPVSAAAQQEQQQEGQRQAEEGEEAEASGSGGPGTIAAPALRPSKTIAKAMLQATNVLHEIDQAVQVCRRLVLCCGAPS